MRVKQLEEMVMELTSKSPDESHQSQMRRTVARGMACRYTNRVWNQPMATYETTEKGEG